MRQRLHLVTLGVADVARSRAFYEALGWEGLGGDGDEPVFFWCGPMAVALWSRAALAEDTGVPDGGGWGGITLAHNVGSPAEVDAVVAAARRAGATVTVPPAPTSWGGYHGVFCDPDGHPWEVAHNPGWQLGADGGIAPG